MKKKILSLVLVLTLLVSCIALVGCKPQAEPDKAFVTFTDGAAKSVIYEKDLINLTIYHKKVTVTKKGGVPDVTYVFSGYSVEDLLALTTLKDTACARFEFSDNAEQPYVKKSAGKTGWFVAISGYKIDTDGTTVSLIEKLPRSFTTNAAELSSGMIVSNLSIIKLINE